jgi:2-dehydro-3-deoxygalactonokinase
VLAARLEPAEVADYVSGLLIGAEVRHALRGTRAAVVVLCGPAATEQRYRFALERGGASVRTVGEDAAAHGLWRIALDAGLVPADPADPAVPGPAAPRPADSAPQAGPTAPNAEEQPA